MSAAVRTARDLWCLVRAGGPRAALADVRDIARRRVYMRSDQLVVGKDLPSGEPRGARSLRMQAAEPHHVPLLAQLSRPRCGARQAHRFATSLADGHRALLGFRDDRLIGYLWWHDGGQAHGFYLSRFGLALADGEVYGYELFIAPEHRGHGTPAEFLAGVEAELVRLGYRRLVGFVDCANVPARWLWATSGYEVILRHRTRTLLRRLVLVDGRGWMLADSERAAPLERPRRTPSPGT